MYGTSQDAAYVNSAQDEFRLRIQRHLLLAIFCIVQVHLATKATRRNVLTIGREGQAPSVD